MRITDIQIQKTTQRIPPLTKKIYGSSEQNDRVYSVQI